MSAIALFLPAEQRQRLRNAVDEEAAQWELTFEFAEYEPHEFGINALALNYDVVVVCPESPAVYAKIERLFPKLYSTRLFMWGSEAQLINSGDIPILSEMSSDAAKTMLSEYREYIMAAARPVGHDTAVGARLGRGGWQDAFTNRAFYKIRTQLEKIHAQLYPDASAFDIVFTTRRVEAKELIPDDFFYESDLAFRLIEYEENDSDAASEGLVVSLSPPAGPDFSASVAPLDDKFDESLLSAGDTPNTQLIKAVDAATTGGGNTTKLRQRDRDARKTLEAFLSLLEEESSQVRERMKALLLRAASVGTQADTRTDAGSVVATLQDLIKGRHRADVERDAAQLDAGRDREEQDDNVPSYASLKDAVSRHVARCRWGTYFELLDLPRESFDATSIRAATKKLVEEVLGIESTLKRYYSDDTELLARAEQARQIYTHSESMLLDDTLRTVYLAGC